MARTQIKQTGLEPSTIVEDEQQMIRNKYTAQCSGNLLDIVNTRSR